MTLQDVEAAEMTDIALSDEVDTARDQRESRTTENTG